jgi:hypothetical protein
MDNKKFPIMKKLVLCLSVVLTLTATRSNAQNMQRMQEAWKSYLKDSIKLADPLVDSVMAVRMQYQPQMRQLFIDQSISDQDKQAKLQNLRSEMDRRYKTVGLTEDQIRQIYEHEERLRAEMMNRMNTGGGR